METKTKQRGRLDVKQGIVVSNKCEKTLSIKITTLIKHPRYKKYIKRHSLLKTHDPQSVGKVGDVVRIKRVPKVSKTKSWQLLSVVSSKQDAGGAGV